MTPHTAAKGLTGLLVDLRLYPEVASQRRHNWIFSFDRGRGDVVCYQYDCPALREKLRDAGFTVGIGSNSCIASMEHLGVLGANFGCGMTNYHDREASCDLAQLERQLERFVRFHRANRARRLPLSLATDRFATMRQPPIRSQERPPSSPMPGMRAFTPAELRRVVSSLEDKPRDRTLVLLGCHTGFRITELLALTVGHVAHGSAIRSEIVLERRNLKGGRGCRARSVTSRRVVLTETARDALADYFSRRFDGPVWPPAAPVFPSRKGSGAIIREQAWRIVRDAAGRAGISGRIGTHSLRKTTAARIFALTGNNLLITQRVLGHRHVTTTAAYLDTTRESVDEAILSLDRVDLDPLGSAQPAGLMSQPR